MTKIDYINMYHVIDDTLTGKNNREATTMITVDVRGVDFKTLVIPIHNRCYRIEFPEQDMNFYVGDEAYALGKDPFLRRGSHVNGRRYVVNAFFKNALPLEVDDYVIKAFTFIVGEQLIKLIPERSE